MAFNVDNLLIKKVRRVVFTDVATGDIYFNASEIENPSLNITSENTQKTDALGVPVATFYNGDSAEFSAENSLFSLGILAAQFGSKIEQASSTNKIVTPCVETIKVKEKAADEKNDKIVLKHIPVGGVKGSEIPFIYILQKNKALGKKYAVNAVASDTAFAVDAAQKTITLPTDEEITADTVIFVSYEYEAESAVKVDKVSGNEPISGKAIVHVIFCDPCNKQTEYAGWLVFGNAQLSPEVDLTFDTESTHPLSFTCQKEWCDEDGKLLSVIVPEA